MTPPPLSEFDRRVRAWGEAALLRVRDPIPDRCHVCKGDTEWILAGPTPLPCCPDCAGILRAREVLAAIRDEVNAEPRSLVQAVTDVDTPEAAVGAVASWMTLFL